MSDVGGGGGCTKRTTWQSGIRKVSVCKRFVRQTNSVISKTCQLGNNTMEWNRRYQRSECGALNKEEIHEFGWRYWVSVNLSEAVNYDVEVILTIVAIRQFVFRMNRFHYLWSVYRTQLGKHQNEKAHDDRRCLHRNSTFNFISSLCFRKSFGFYLLWS